MALKLTLKAARVNAGMTQKEVAEKMDRNVSTIINWENGVGKNITWYDFRKICKILKVNPNDIFFKE